MYVNVIDYFQMAPVAIDRLKKNYQSLCALAGPDPKVRKAVLNSADKELVYCLADCIYNILKFNVPLTREQNRKLYKYRKEMRKIAHKRTKVSEKKRLLQKGGFLPLLLTPLLGIAGSLIGDAISSAINK